MSRISWFLLLKRSLRFGHLWQLFIFQADLKCIDIPSLDCDIKRKLKWPLNQTQILGERDQDLKRQGGKKKKSTKVEEE